MPGPPPLLTPWPLPSIGARIISPHISRHSSVQSATPIPGLVFLAAGFACRPLCPFDVYSLPSRANRISQLRQAPNCTPLRRRRRYRQRASVTARGSFQTPAGYIFRSAAPASAAQTGRSTAVQRLPQRSSTSTTGRAPSAVVVVRAGWSTRLASSRQKAQPAPTLFASSRPAKAPPRLGLSLAAKARLYCIRVLLAVLLNLVLSSTRTTPRQSR